MCDTVLEVIDRQRGQRVDRPRLHAYLSRAVQMRPPSGASEFSVCLVSDRRMRELNRRFRGRDVPTDVLSFPSDEDRGGPGREYLGDIAISVDTAARQAKEVRHSLQRELEVLALHGYLHLLGYDHDRDRGEMMRLQRRIDRRLTSERAPRERRKPS